MQIFDVIEAKTHWSDLLDQVEMGAQIVITKQGRSMAKLMPMGDVDREVVRNTIRRLKAFGKLNKLNGLNWKELRDKR